MVDENELIVFLPEEAPAVLAGEILDNIFEGRCFEK
jgi:hypothetical protein